MWMCEVWNNEILRLLLFNIKKAEENGLAAAFLVKASGLVQTQESMSHYNQGHDKKQLGPWQEAAWTIKKAL